MAQPRLVTVIAVTGDDDRYESVRQKAADLAGTAKQALILYDWDAPTLFGDPLPTWWSGEGSEGMFSRRLDEKHLRAAGRAGIADQVAEARQSGLEAFGWLPSEHGPGALATYALEQRASTIVVPAALKEVGGLEAVLNGTTQPAETLSAETRARVVIVDEA